MDEQDRLFLFLDEFKLERPLGTVVVVAGEEEATTATLLFGDWRKRRCSVEEPAGNEAQGQGHARVQEEIE